MADLKTMARREIARLKKSIAEQADKLTLLKRDLEKHERIARMLQERPGPKKSPRRGTVEQEKKKTRARMDWSSLLEGLPASFTASQVKEACGESSNYADVHQAILRWRKAGRVKTHGRGQYRKTQAAEE